MQKELIKRFQDAFPKLLGQTKTCKMCFNNYEIKSIYSLFNKDIVVCSRCINEFHPKFIKFRTEGVTCWSIYDYDDLLKDKIYQFKGCYDFELKDIFIKQFSKELSLVFKGYTMVPAPSFFDENVRRGYNHVCEIFKDLNLPMVEAFEKSKKVKQAEQGFFDRKKISKFIRFKKGIILEKKKILLIDDIYTTGSTFRTMISLLKEQGITEIKGLVICKTRLK